MSKYVYQIKGTLENVQGQFTGLRILVCDIQNIDLVDVPAEILDVTTAKYLQFRINVVPGILNIQKLPVEVQNKIRAPLGRWLDRWVLENFHGNISKRKSINS
jgi:hypothetical protein